MVSEKNYLSLSGNALKIIAAIAMLIDHAGILLFPRYPIFRIIGRLAFPIYAFMIAEGCRYTRNKIRYFLGIFSLAALCQLVYFFYDSSLYMCILVTFSLSILMIYALQYFKKCFFDPDKSVIIKILSGLLFLGSVIFTYLLNKVFSIDYGFWGCMLPVFASVFHSAGEHYPNFLKKLDIIPLHVMALGAGMLIRLMRTSSPIQVYAFFALPLLLLYSGKRGRLKMKYFFYIFYPVHLVVLEGIAMLVYYL